MIHWDNTINLGTLITIVPVLVFFVRIIRHMDRLELKVDEMWLWFLNNTERKLVLRSRKDDNVSN